jgi:hypothetical protein
MQNFGDSFRAKFAELIFRGLRRCRSELNTGRDRKRKNRIFEPSRESDTPLTMPLKDSRFLCRSRPRYPWHFKGALNALVADELRVDGPGT